MGRDLATVARGSIGVRKKHTFQSIMLNYGLYIAMVATFVVFTIIMIVSSLLVIL